MTVASFVDTNVLVYADDLFAPADVLHAIDLHRRYGFSIWDALIVRAALVGECRRLYSEDLQAGFRIGDLEIVNPFAE